MASSYWNSLDYQLRLLGHLMNFGRQSQRAVILIINQTLNNEFLKLGNLSPKRIILSLKILLVPIIIF